MGRTIPTWPRWTPSRVGGVAFALVLTFLVAFAMVLAGWSSWCSTIGVAVIDDRLARLDRGAVTRGMLLEFGGAALWALPWAALAVLRRHRGPETAAYVILAASLLLHSEELFREAVSDPVLAERVQCWHF